MFMVLRDEDGNYFEKMVKNKYDIDYPMYTDELQEARVFKVTCQDGKLVTDPELPPGEWEPCSVELTLKPEL